MLLQPQEALTCVLGRQGVFRDAVRIKTRRLGVLSQSQEASRGAVTIKTRCLGVLLQSQEAALWGVLGRQGVFRGTVRIIRCAVTTTRGIVGCVRSARGVQGCC